MLLQMKMRLRDLGISLQRVVWTRRAQSWEDTPNAGLDRVVEEIVRRAQGTPVSSVVDLGSGSGQLALPLAAFAGTVIAVDIAPTMLDILSKKANALSITNIETRCEPLESLDFEPASLDLIVSNYVLHHLGDADKQRLLVSCYGWLRPGGRLIIGDMMFGRGSSSADRRIIAEKVLKLAKLGLGGWWRIAKNIARFTFRIQEKPVSAQTWTRYLHSAGFQNVSIDVVVAEASIAIATK